MIEKYGKFFRNLSNSKISCFQYDINQNYYTLIREKQNEGFAQCIITSNIMIEIMQYFILKGDTSIISIEFMVEHDEIEDEIKFILKRMKENIIHWIDLKEKILFLSQNDCIEVKKIELKNINGLGYIFSIQVNGIIIVPEEKFDRVSNMIAGIIESGIK